MIFLKLNQYGVIDIFDLQGEEINKGNYEVNSIFVTYDNYKTRTSLVGYLCTFSFQKSNGEEVNDMISTMDSYVYNGKEYVGFKFLFTSKAITDVAGQMICTIRLISPSSTDNNIVSSTGIPLNVNDNGRNVGQVFITESQYQSILEAISNKAEYAYVDEKVAEAVNDLNDRKLDKVTTQSIYEQVYAKTASGEQAMLDVGDISRPNTIIKRDGSGRAQVTEPIYASEIANKSYVDSVENRIKEKANTTVVVDADNITAKDYFTEVKNAYFNNKTPIVYILKVVSGTPKLFLCDRVVSTTTNILCQHVHSVIQSGESETKIALTIMEVDLSSSGASGNSYRESSTVKAYDVTTIDARLDDLKTFVDNRVAEILGTVPEDLNSLEEIVNAFQNADQDFAKAINDLANSKVDKTVYDSDISRLQEISGTRISYNPETSSLIIEKAFDTLEVEQLLNGRYGTSVSSEEGNQ